MWLGLAPLRRTVPPVRPRELSRRVKRRFPVLLAASWWVRSLVDHWLLHRPHDDSYRVLAQLELGPGPIVDIGANMGQSALSMRLFAPNEIVSFEINPLLRKHLDMTSRIVRRHRVHITGLGASRSDALLHTPRFGRFRVTSRASLSEGYLEQQRTSLERRFGRRMAIDTTPAVIRRLDEFDLAPSFVKIDVEGLEHEVLRGAEQTLVQHFPPVLYEQLHGTDDARRFLESLGYTTFEVRDGRIEACDPGRSDALNLLALRIEGADGRQAG